MTTEPGVQPTASTTPTDEAVSVLAGIESLARGWTAARSERMTRRHLDPSDFAALADTGYLRLIVPRDHGGLWRSQHETGPVIVEAVRRLAAGDPSVALVASMHPTVLGFWAAATAAPGEERSAWADQQAEVFATAIEGHFWGTITSEPGSGGDVMATRTIATELADGGYGLRGDKHFGSGSGVVSYMVTTARPTGAELPMAFYLDLRDQPWDGTAGLHITREWDGMGMRATQSHAVRLDGIRGEPWAWQGALLEAAPVITAIGLSAFCAVVLAVCDAAMEEAGRRLGGRRLRAFEEVAFAQAEVDHWMLTQAHAGLTATLARGSAPDALLASTKAKIGMAATAESFMDQVCRAVGGSAFSASSPFATWYEDVRALGYLRPPWALAFEQLATARMAATD